jgi:FkbM family methyltransferase
MRAASRSARGVGGSRGGYLACVDQVGLLGLYEAVTDRVAALGAPRLVRPVRTLLDPRLGRLAPRARLRGLRIGGPSAWHATHVRAWRRGHEYWMAEYLAAAVRTGTTVLDVGAYVGYFTLLAAERVGPRGHVIAFEPHPESRAALVGNVRANRLQARVTVAAVALSAASARHAFALESNPSQSGLVDAGDATIDVPCVAADEYLTGAPPDTIKIDVEGSELAVLSGMRQTLRRAGDVVLVIECNPETLRRTGASPQALLECLRALDLEPRVIDERSGRLLAAELPTILERPWVNLYCTRPGSTRRPDTPPATVDGRR